MTKRTQEMKEYIDRRIFDLHFLIIKMEMQGRWGIAKDLRKVLADVFKELGYKYE